MNSDMIYLDNNATTKPLQEVTEVVLSAMNENWGNPSSIHRIGQEARHQVDLARESVAKLIGSTPAEITFTSGGTEAANLAIQTACDLHPEKKVIVTSHIEHAAVGEKADALAECGMEIIRLRNCSNGVMCMAHLKELLEDRASEIALVSLMWCNNETGVIEPIEEATRLCHEHGVLIHSDGTQWVAKMPVDIHEVPVDLLSFAAHKFHGPKGVGALYARMGVAVSPLVTGGPQERGRRGGTENVPAILGFGVACESAMTWLTSENIEAMEANKASFEDALQAALPAIHINSSGAARAWTTSSVLFPNVKGELMLLVLSENGVCASSGSACSSGALKESKVIEALGTPEEGEWGAVRFSFARTTTKDELLQAVEAIVETLAMIESIVTAAEPSQATT